MHAAQVGRVEELRSVEPYIAKFGAKLSKFLQIKDNSISIGSTENNFGKLLLKNVENNCIGINCPWIIFIGYRYREWRKYKNSFLRTKTLKQFLLKCKKSILLQQI